MKCSASLKFLSGCCLCVQPLEGFMDVNDPTMRYSNREFFKNIAPLICELKALGGPLVLSTDGSTQLSLDGAFFGQRTWATVRLCMGCASCL
jgi:hypothetical protein